MSGPMKPHFDVKIGLGIVFGLGLGLEQLLIGVISN